jgi:hypothetical protein
MSSQAYVNQLIVQNDWSSLHQFLKSEHGEIGKLVGGRYSYRVTGDKQGLLDIGMVSWKIFSSTSTESFKTLPLSEQKAADHVITELNRLYDDTDSELLNASYLGCVTTRIYDFCEIFTNFIPALVKVKSS